MNWSDIFGNHSESYVENDTSPNFNLPEPPMSDYILIPAGILMMVENIISIGLLYISSRLSFQIRIMSLNLALSDLLTGIFISIPNAMLYENYQCDIKKYLGFLFTTVSLFIITMMNLDRCCVFILAMRYYSFITRKLMLKISVASWVLGLIMIYGLFFDFKNKYGISCQVMAYVKRNAVSLFFRCILLTIVAFNLIMFIYMVCQIRLKLGRSTDAKDSAQSIVFAREQARIARKISIITGVFLTAFIPFMVIYTFPFNFESKIVVQIYTTSLTTILFNSACNPLFYVWRFSEPRYHIKRIFCFWNKKQRQKFEKKRNQKKASYIIDPKTPMTSLNQISQGKYKENNVPE